MKSFKTILLFEYLGYIRSKAYRITTVTFIVILLIAGFLPQIVDGIGGMIKDDGKGSANAAFIVSDEAKAEGFDKAVDAGSLDKAVDSYSWKIEHGSPEDISKDYSVTVYLRANLEYDLYTSGEDLNSLSAADTISVYLQAVSRQLSIASLPADMQGSVNDILNKTATPNIISVGGDAMQNYWLGYVLIFLLYFVIIMYGQFVVTSVVTEKSSKAMELLITSANSNSLMFGKVTGVGLAAMTQIIVIILAGAAAINLNKGAWEDFVPFVFGILESSPLSVSLIVYFVVFFILGYYLYAFLYAALASTVSRMEDASSVVALPMMLVVIAFLISMVGLASIDTMAIKICSFVPFFSPMLMFSRICMGSATNFEVLVSIALLFATILLVGWLAAKIYRMGVTMYGQKMSLINILKAARNY